MGQVLFEGISYLCVGTFLPTVCLGRSPIRGLPILGRWPSKLVSLQGNFPESQSELRVQSQRVLKYMLVSSSPFLHLVRLYNFHRNNCNRKKSKEKSIGKFSVTLVTFWWFNVEILKLETVPSAGLSVDCWVWRCKGVWCVSPRELGSCDQTQIIDPAWWDFHLAELPPFTHVKKYLIVISCWK